MKMLIAVTLGLLCIRFPAMAEDFPEAVKRPIQESITIRQNTQQSEDRWSAERTKLEAEYDALKKEQTHLAALQNDLSRQARAQEDAIISLETQLNEIEQISKELVPYLEEVYTRFQSHVRNDFPFLIEERTERLDNLRHILDDVQVPTSEKFRKVMEALFIEAEYGNTVEVYQDQILVQGKDILVNIFRLGRISLFFQSLDQTMTGYYHRAESAWVILPAGFNREIHEAIKMGAKQRSVDMLTLPIGRIITK